jgi:hypothetical protein
MKTRNRKKIIIFWIACQVIAFSLLFPPTLPVRAQQPQPVTGGFYISAFVFTISFDPNGGPITFQQYPPGEVADQEPQLITAYNDEMLCGLTDQKLRRYITIYNVGAEGGVAFSQAVFGYQNFSHNLDTGICTPYAYTELYGTFTGGPNGTLTFPTPNDVYVTTCQVMDGKSIECNFVMEDLDSTWRKVFTIENPEAFETAVNPPVQTTSEYISPMPESTEEAIDTPMPEPTEEAIDTPMPEPTEEVISPTTPVSAADCLSDPLNAAGCMSTPFVRQGVAAVIGVGATLATILVSMLGGAGTAAGESAAEATAAAGTMYGSGTPDDPYRDAGAFKPGPAGKLERYPEMAGQPLNIYGSGRPDDPYRDFPDSGQTTTEVAEPDGAGGSQPAPPTQTPSPQPAGGQAAQTPVTPLTQSPVGQAPLPPEPAAPQIPQTPTSTTGEQTAGDIAKGLEQAVDSGWFDALKNGIGTSSTLAGAMSELLTFADSPKTIQTIRDALKAWQNNPSAEGLKDYLNQLGKTSGNRLGKLAKVFDFAGTSMDMLEAVGKGLAEADRQGFTGLDQQLIIWSELGKKDLTWLLTKNPIVGLADWGMGTITQTIWGKNSRMDIGALIDKGGDKWKDTVREYASNTGGGAEADASNQTAEQFLNSIRRIKEQIKNGQISQEEGSARARKLQQTLMGGAQ